MKANLNQFNLMTLLFVCCTLTAWGKGSQNLTGNIFTTTSDGKTVNANLFTAKTAVYLNGGPQNGNASGLPQGTYYFQVTDPSGATLLSADNIDCRIVVVGSNNRIDGPGTAGPNCVAPQALHVGGTTDPTNGSTGVQLCPAAAGNGSASDPNNWCDTTPNGGGEYKVWLTPTTAYDTTNCGNFGFCDSTSKTDNFKIKPSSCSGSDCGKTPVFTIVWPLGGEKFYDANANGVQDPGEPIIDGWQVRAVKSCQEDQTVLASELGAILGGTVVLPVNDLDFITPPPTPYGRQFQYTAFGTYETDAFQDPNAPTTFTGDGYYQFKDLNAGGHYSVCEIIPRGAASLLSGSSSLNGHPKWFATSATEHDGIFLPTVDASFGNVCTGPGGGLTLGFWSNTNGEGIMGGTGKAPSSCYAKTDKTDTMHNTLTFLAQFNLVDANGSPIATQLSTPWSSSFDPYCFFRSWILGATATNSAYMLSAQMAAMELNIHFGKVNANALIYAPGSNSANSAGFATLSDVLAEANNSLGTNPYVVAHGLLNNNVTLKTYQIALKDALDNANNNLGFVQPGPSSCAISYLDESNNSCIPSDAPAGTTNTWQPIPESGGCPVNSLINLLAPR